MIDVHCVSVLGGWQTEVTATGYRFGPVFNSTADLWAWQKDNLYEKNPHLCATSAAPASVIWDYRDALAQMKGLQS